MSRQPVLDSYTDEYLKANLSSPVAGVVARTRQLLSIPAEARQAVAIEAHYLSSRTTYARTPGGGQIAQTEMIGSVDDAYDLVVAAYLAGDPFTSPAARDYDPRS